MVNYQEDAKEIAKFLLQIKAIILQPDNPFTWASGWKSPIYCDNRKTLSFPSIRTHIRIKLCEIIKEQYPHVNVIAGVATGAIAHGMMIAEKLNLPFIYVRGEAKGHGRQNQIEGQLESDQKVLVIEDLISTGKSSLNAVNALKKEGVEVLGMLGLFDYGFDLAKENFKAEKIQLYTLSDYNNLIIEAEQSNYIKAEEISLLKSWRVSPSEWQPY